MQVAARQQEETGREPDDADHDTGAHRDQRQDNEAGGHAEIGDRVAGEPCRSQA